MDTWRSDGPDTDDGDVIEIIPMEEYDSQKAKLRTSLAWILGKAFKDEVPPEFRDPFYQSGQGIWQLKPRLMNLMTTSELYCQACQTMFGESASQWQGHWSIIQVLSRKGIYAVGTDDVDVTETILMQTAPFRITAHLALINALMTAFTREIITIERVTQSVRRFSSFNASSELPSDVEDAIQFWVNKVCVTVQYMYDKSQEQLLEGETNQKVRIVSSRTPRDAVRVPQMENLLSDLGDGCSLAAVISFYCPQLLRLEDICLKANVGIADSLYNLRLLRAFCDKHLPNKCFHFTYEDFLYSQETLKENFLMFIAELFYWFEIKRVAIVTGGGYQQVTEQGDGSRPTTAKQLSAGQVHSIPISNVTKQSFQRLRSDSELRSSSSPDIHNKHSPSAPVPPRMPLLHKRHQQGQGHYDDSSVPHAGQRHNVRRTNSLTSRDVAAQGTRQSVLAWQENNPPPVVTTETLPQLANSTASNNLLANVSIDSDMNESFSSASIDLGDLDNSPRPNTDRSHVTDDGNTIQFRLQDQPRQPPVERLELESVHSGAASSQVSNTEEVVAGEENHEPLMPARLKPSKEKTNNHTKEEERGGDSSLRRKMSSPPRSKKVGGEDSELFATGERSDSSLSENRVTPLPEEQLSHREYQTPGLQQPDPMSDRKTFEAFFIRGSVGDSSLISTHRTDDSVSKESYVLSEQFTTPEAARAAGVPVVGESADTIVTPTGRISREGSIASSRSSGDFSDHESRKIHFDHKARESCDIKKPSQLSISSSSDVSDPGSFIIQKPVIITRQPQENKSDKTLETNFARIKRMKDIGKIDNSGTVYMQHGRDDDKKSSLKDALQKNRAEKKTSFAPLPNQTTWQKTASASNQNSDGASGSSANGSAGSEMLKIRLKLEEKRKAIERKKHSEEIQLQRMRQRLGKDAFLHVVSHSKPEPASRDAESVPSASQQIQPSRMTISDPQVQVQVGQPSPNTSATSSPRPVKSPLQSPTHPKNPRRYSREDIQNTIENVRKKWFKEDDLVAPKMRSGQSDSPEMVRSEPAVSTDRQDDRLVASADQEKPESYEEYSSDLDKLNQSLTDLQGEIMKLSLKQGQKTPVSSTDKTITSKPESPATRSRSRSKSPPSVLEVAKKTLPDASMQAVPETNRVTGPVRSQVRSASEPRQIAPEETVDMTYQSSTLPRPVGYHSNQVPPFMMQNSVTVAGPAGPVYSGPNQFVPVHTNTGIPPTAQQYGSYLMGHTPPQQMGAIPQQLGMAGFQQSPPQMYPGTVPSSMFSQPYPPQPQHMMTSPAQTQPYPGAMYPSPPQTHYQPVQQFANTYTVHSQPQQPHMAPVAQQPESIIQPPSRDLVQPQVHPDWPPVSAQGTEQPKQAQPRDLGPLEPRRQDTVPVSSPRRRDTAPGPKAVSDESAMDQISDDSGFFVTIAEGSPRRQKTTTSVNSDMSVKKPVIGQDNSVHVTREGQQTYGGSSIIADFAQHQGHVTQESADTSQTLNQSDTKEADVSGTGVGFVVGQDETSLDRSAEFEMMRKKEKLLQMRMKRQEEQEKKRLDKEMDQAKKREAERLKSEEGERRRQEEKAKYMAEEGERRRQEEKARREAIFSHYIKKKEEGDEETPPKKKTTKKMRPKSMFSKGGAAAAGLDPSEGLETYSSAEDLNARAYTLNAGNNATAYFFSLDSPTTIGSDHTRGSRSSRNAPPPSRTMRKAVSCNVLSQNQDGSASSGSSQGDKSLAFGGLTHRRPPSPDLYRLRRGNRSNESSEAGSATGVDYTGPKLFVKPSAKSNRHIMINAISHVCLAGSVNTDMKNKVLEEIAKSDAKHFIILFRDASCSYRGMYSFDPDTEDLTKIMGVGPRQITSKMVEKYYKYNSGGKQFVVVASTKHISVSIDAICLQNSVWKVNKAPAKGYR